VHGGGQVGWLASLGPCFCFLCAGSGNMSGNTKMIMRVGLLHMYLEYYICQVLVGVL
jgi:hypothetical protein